MQITEAYETLRRYGHVGDQYSFDRNWLGKKEGHFAYLKSTRSQPSVETLLRLHFKLLEHDNRATRWGIATGEIAELAASTMDEIRERCGRT